jgi:hypothetical protein
MNPEHATCRSTGFDDDLAFETHLELFMGQQRQRRRCDSWRTLLPVISVKDWRVRKHTNAEFDGIPKTPMKARR